MCGTSREISPACAHPLSLWKVWSQISLMEPVGVGVVARPRLPLVDAAGHHVEQVRDHTARQDELAVGVPPVHAPRVRRALGENLELLRDFGWNRQTAAFMRVAGAVELVVAVFLHVARGSPWVPSHLSDAVNTPCRPYSQPSGPHWKVLSVSCVSWLPKPLQQHLELARLVVLVFDEPQVRRRPRRTPRRGRPRCRYARSNAPSPAAARSGRDREVLALGEHGPLVAHAVAVGVLQDDDAVAGGLALGRAATGTRSTRPPRSRPRSSMVKATGLTTCGSPANSLTSNSGATVKRLTVSSGVRYGWPDDFRLSNPNCFWADAADVARKRTTSGRSRRMGRTRKMERG